MSTQKTTVEILQWFFFALSFKVCAVNSLYATCAPHRKDIPASSQHSKHGYSTGKELCGATCDRQVFFRRCWGWVFLSWLIESDLIVFWSRRGGSRYRRGDI